MPPELAVRSDRVVSPEGIRPASILVGDGRILGVDSRNAEVPSGCDILDAGHSVVMAGLVDTHVHINDPGRAAWEGFQTATRAAAAGGITCVVDMPLNSIPATTTVDALEEKWTAARGNCWVDVGFWGGVVPGNTQQLRSLHEAGVLGFKCFLVSSGVAEFEHVAPTDLRAALNELAELGAVLIVHAELPRAIDAATRELSRKGSADPCAYATFLASRPARAENEAVALLVDLCRATRARMHVVHLSSAGALPLLRQAREEGLPLTAETCPHYLCLAAEEIPPGATEYKCCPPIRERENQERLWAALSEGLVEMIVSDHSPCPPGLKLPGEGDFLRAWGGIASLELRLPVMWTAARRRSFGLEQLARWLSEKPAELVGLEKRKGSIRVACDADLVVWDPEAIFRVDAARLHQRHKLTPYAGQTLQGVVEATFVRGAKVYERGRFAASPTGQLLKRGG